MGVIPRSGAALGTATRSHSIRFLTMTVQSAAPGPGWRRHRLTLASATSTVTWNRGRGCHTSAYSPRMRWAIRVTQAEGRA